MLQPSIDFLVIFGIAGLESDFLLISDHLLLKANCPAARKENERKIAAGKINAINKRDLPSARQFLFLLSISLVPGGYILGLRKQGKGMLELLLNGG